MGNLFRNDERGIYAQMEHSKELFIDRGVSNLLKFTSALLIAFHHYAQYVVHLESDSPAWERIIWQLLSTQGGYLGVAVFFFLSGYGLMESEQKRHLSMTEFIDKRLKRVIFPLVVLAVVWVPLYYGFDLSYPATSDSAGAVVTRILNIGGWFVTAILIMYVVFMLFCHFINRYGIRKASGTLMLATIAVYVLCDKLLGEYTALSIPIFTVGIIASLYKRRYHGKYMHHSLIYVGIAMIFAVVYSILMCHSFPLAVHAVINYVALTGLILIFSHYRMSMVFPGVLGEIAFDIYLIHRKIITAYFAVYGTLMPLLLWCGVTMAAVMLFVLFRKQLWKIVFENRLSVNC